MRAWRGGAGVGAEAAPTLRWSLRLALLCLACLPALGTLGAPWISDDALILGHVHRHGALADWLQPQYDLITIRFWRPLVSLSWSLQEGLWGVDPLPFRALNLACHALCALLVAELLLALGAGTLGALLAGVACGWFPEQGGTVTWVAGRVDSLTLPFFAGALLALARGRAGLAALCAFLACACKETSFALPALGAVVALVAWPGGATRSRLAGSWIALSAACALAFGWRRLALGEWLGGYPAPAGGALAALAPAARALWSSAWPSIAGTLVLAALGTWLGTARPRLVAAGLACALLGAAPLFALLADGVLEETNRRTLAFFDLGLVLALGGALARWRGGAGFAVLAVGLCVCGMRARLAWVDTHEWAEAGRVAERAAERARAEALEAGAGPRPLLALVLPRVHGGAYALAWGVADRARAPFPAAARPVWPARPVFSTDGGEVRSFEPPYERIGSSYLRREGSAETHAAPSDGMEELRVSAQDGGPLGALRIDERIPSASPDTSDAFVLDAAQLSAFDGVELVLYTELGYQPFAWDRAHPRVSLMEAFACSDGRVTLGDVWLLAASAGAERAWLEVRAWRGERAHSAAASAWIELTWDPAVLDVARRMLGY